MLPLHPHRVAKDGDLYGFRFVGEDSAEVANQWIVDLGHSALSFNHTPVVPMWIALLDGRRALIVPFEQLRQTALAKRHILVVCDTGRPRAIGLATRHKRLRICSDTDQLARGIRQFGLDRSIGRHLEGWVRRPRECGCRGREVGRPHARTRNTRTLTPLCSPRAYQSASYRHSLYEQLPRGTYASGRKRRMAKARG